MSEMMHPAMMALVAELAISAKETIESHFKMDEAGENTLRHYGPLQLTLSTDDGALAELNWEEGVKIYPEAKNDPRLESAARILETVLDSKTLSIDDAEIINSARNILLELP